MTLLSMFLATGNGQYNFLNQLLQFYLPVHITYVYTIHEGEAVWVAILAQQTNLNVIPQMLRWRRREALFQSISRLPDDYNTSHLPSAIARIPSL